MSVFPPPYLLPLVCSARRLGEANTCERAVERRLKGKNGARTREGEEGSEEGRERGKYVTVMSRR